MADEFCKVFNAMLRRRGLDAPRKGRKRDYHRDGRLSQAEIILIMVMFHNSNHKCLKLFYLNENASWAIARASVSWTVPCCGFAATNAYTCSRCSRG